MRQEWVPRRCEYECQKHCFLLVWVGAIRRAGETINVFSFLGVVGGGRQRCER